MMELGGHRVYVGDIGSRCQREDLEKEFGRFGPVIDVYMGRQKEPGLPLFAFVVFKYPDDAEEAVKEKNGKQLLGRPVIVEHARAPREKPDFRGRGRGDWVPRGRGGYNDRPFYNNNHYNDFYRGRGGRNGVTYGRGSYDNHYYGQRAPWGERGFRDNFMPRRRSPMRRSPLRRSPLRHFSPLRHYSPLRRLSPFRPSRSRERYQRSPSPLYQQPLERWHSPLDRGAPLEVVDHRRIDSYTHYQGSYEHEHVKVTRHQEPRQYSQSPEPRRSKPKAKKISKSKRKRSVTRSPSPPPKKKSKKKRRKSTSSEDSSSSSSSSEESRSPTPPPKKKKKRKQKQRSPPSHSKTRSRSRSKTPGYDAKAYSYFNSVVSSTNNIVRKPIKREVSVEKKEKSSKNRSKKYSDSEHYSSSSN